MAAMVNRPRPCGIHESFAPSRCLCVREWLWTETRSPGYEYLQAGGLGEAGGDFFLIVVLGGIATFFDEH
jgi:hypothetical protein